MPALDVVRPNAPGTSLVAAGQANIAHQHVPMTDQDIEVIRGHAETMAWILVEMHQDHRHIAE